MTKEIKIVLADAQYITSMGLRYLLSLTENLSVVDVVSNLTELMASIGKHQPDLVILDYNQPESFYLVDIPQIIESHPEVHLLIISEDDETSNIRQTIKFGIKGFLTKECREDELQNAIQAILNGGRFFCDKVVDVLMESNAATKKRDEAFEQLTDREKEIVRMVAEGLSTKQIAEKLFLSPHTISTHRKNALKKLNVGSVPELISFVIREDLKKT